MSLQKKDWTHKPWADRTDGWVATSKHGSVCDLPPTSIIRAITVIGDGNQTGNYFRIIYWVLQEGSTVNYVTYQEVGTFRLISKEQVNQIVAATADELVDVSHFGVYRKDGILSSRFVSMMILN